MIDPDAILRERLGPPPSELVQLVLERVQSGDVRAVVIVTQRGDEALSLYSAGCTTLETVGMLAWAAYHSAPAVPNECDDDAHDADGLEGVGR